MCIHTHTLIMTMQNVSWFPNYKQEGELYQTGQHSWYWSNRLFNFQDSCL